MTFSASATVGFAEIHSSNESHQLSVRPI